MKTFNLTVSYNGSAETWDEIRNDAENEKINNVFIGTKEFVNVVRCKECKWWKREVGEIGDDFSCSFDYNKSYKEDFFCADGERGEQE